ncbi:MAG: leucine-rich repeat protein [Treponema sp.]|nr:leucine-rich repeat protein [Treponema sp.]
MNKAKSEIKNLLSLLIWGMVFITSSCTWFSSSKLDENENGSNEGKKATLYIKVSNSGKNVPKNKSRTIKAEDFTKKEFTDVVLKGKYFSSSEEEELLTADSLEHLDSVITVNSGFWDFTLSAEYNGLLFSDTKSYTVKSEGTNTVSFNLKAVEDFGGCEISFTFAQTTVEKALVSLQSLQGAGGTTLINRENLVVSFVENGKKCDFTRSLTNEAERLPSGKYLLSFEFYGSSGTSSGAADILLNHYESYLVITAGQIAKADINLDLNAIYTITYKDGSESVTDDDVASGLLISSYSKLSEFDLPTITKSGYIFQGWQKNGSGDLIQKIDRNTYGDITLVASFIEAKLYVSGVGDDTSGDGSLDNPFESIDKACEKIIELGAPDAEWTIYIAGNVTGPHEGTNTYGQSSVPADVTLNYAKSITLEGKNGLDANNLPQDRIDKGWQSSSGLAGFAVKIDTTVPVTIINLEITKGRGGLYIAQGATVMLGDGVRIIGNNQGANGCGGGVRNEGTLFVYGSAVIGNQNATQAANGSSSDSYIYNYSNPSDDTRINANYSIYGAGIYNGTYNSDNTIEAKLYLCYRGFDTDGVTPVEETLTGGIYANSASSGGGIYNDKNCTVYYKSGTIKYNGTSGEGGGIVNYGLVEMCGENAKILNNTASSGGGISNKTTGRFLMSAGQINNNTATGYGGGIYNVSDCYIYSKAIIGDKTASTAATATAYGNTARNGGGISNSNGNLYVGFKPDGSVDASYTANGGIYYNYATGTGSSDSYGGGAIYSTGSNGYGKTFLGAGTLAYNASGAYGGGIYVGGKLVEISGGTIENNFAANGGGAIIYNSWLHGFAMKGNPSIPKGADNKNDILLTATADITITGNLDASLNSYYLTFSPYNRTAPVLLLGEGSETTLADAYKKFEIAQPIITDSDGNQHTPHMILTDGNLPNGCYLIEADTWEGDLARYIEAMTESGTVRVGGAITRDLAQTVLTALESKDSEFRLSLDLSKTTGWGDSMPSFEGCEKLKDFVFPNNLSSMRLDLNNNGNLFKNCSSLETITIPVSLKTIYSNFDGCDSLRHVYYMGSESQKANISFPSLTKNGVPTQETIISNIEPIDPNRPVIWHYLGYGYTITIDTGTDSDIEVSVTDGSSPITDIATINKGTPLTFTVTSSGYTTYKWKVDGTLKSETSSLTVDTTNWAVGATYIISLIAADDSGNEDSYFAQITVTE